MYPCGLEGYSCAGEKDGKYQGVFMQLHPTPSGNERHILRFSTKDYFPTPEEATYAIESILNVHERTENAKD